MVKSNGDLDQTLVELFFGFRRSPPNVFEDFVGLEKRSPIKEPDSMQIFGGMHALLWHTTPECFARRLYGISYSEAAVHPFFNIAWSLQLQIFENTDCYEVLFWNASCMISVNHRCVTGVVSLSGRQS
jgi:hypothetical protein